MQNVYNFSVFGFDMSFSMTAFGILTAFNAALFLMTLVPSLDFTQKFVALFSKNLFTQYAYVIIKGLIGFGLLYLWPLELTLATLLMVPGILIMALRYKNAFNQIAASIALNSPQK